MRFIYLIMVSFIIISCQKEELIINDSQDQNSFLTDAVLTRLMMSVSAHDGSFDDIVDNATCFSINFPYQLNYNGEIIIINSASDLLSLNKNYNITPIFPLTISLADYSEVNISSLNQLISYVTLCDNGDLYNDRIVCTDFNYPIYISLYNTQTSNFETLTFDHDKDTFTSILSFDENTIASINYPLVLFDNNGIEKEILNNGQLKNFILQIAINCD